MSNTTRFATLLGECRRQMNGAVVGSMKFYGDDYGLNYGVSLPTIRELAKAEGQDHSYAQYLYQQQVREIRLISFWVADPLQIGSSDLDFWGNGIINSEVAEEASFALFQYVDIVADWLSSSNNLLVYTSLLSISKRRTADLNSISHLIEDIVKQNVHILASAVVTLLESYYRDELNRNMVHSILKLLPENRAGDYIKSEMEWRMESSDF